MIEPITNLPPEVTGVRAMGRVERNDHQAVLGAVVEEASRDGRKLRLLYELGPDVKGFTLGAALEEARFAQRHSDMMERFALVSDSRMARGVAERAAAVAPFSMRVFGSAERQQAIEWLSRPPVEQGLSHEFRSDMGVLIIRPHGTLQAEDFDALGRALDAIVHSGSLLRGIVVQTSSLPGWSNLGSFLRHARFMRKAQRRVARVALAADGTVALGIALLAQYFVDPELKSFSYDNLERAVRWAAGGAADHPADAEPAIDRVHEASEDSFPASDPPSYTPKA